MTDEVAIPPTAGAPIDRTALEEALIASDAVRPGARLQEVRSRPIGIGATADTLLLLLTWFPEGGGPDRVVVKLPATDPAAARTAASLGLYEREARFYTELAPRTGLRVPRCFGTLTTASGAPALLLEDLTRSHTPGDQFAELPPPLLQRARRELVALQAPFWADPAVASLPWLHRRLGVAIPSIHERMCWSWAERREELAGHFDDDERAVVDRFVAGADAWARSVDGPFSLTHHDFRIDNLLFADDDLVVLDWQTAGWGAPMFDLAYLLGTSLTPATRRAVEADQVRAHVRDLAEHGITWAPVDAWRAYRQASFAVLLMLVPPTGSVKRTARSDDMFRLLLRRGARMALDLGADEFLSTA
jgi:aminoglycoside phosphotransferase (APT) family kinase protein